MGRARGRRCSEQDFLESVTLGRIGAFVDDGLLTSVAVRDLARPFQDQRPFQAIESRVVEVALVDAAAKNGLTEAMGRGDLPGDFRTD